MEATFTIFRFRSDGAFWMAWVDFQVGFFGGKFEGLSEIASKQTHTEAALEKYQLLCCVCVFFTVTVVTGACDECLLVKGCLFFNFTFKIGLKMVCVFSPV